MDINSLIKLYQSEKSGEERGNFNTLWQSAAEWCNPAADNIYRLSTPGERKCIHRMIDVGIKARRMFTAGMMSHLFPQGQSWINIVPRDRSLLKSDAVKRALSDATKTFAGEIEASNFYEEMGQCIDHSGYIGTTALYCEETEKSPLNWRSHYINTFYFCEDYEGNVDTFIRDFMLTPRQAMQQFGEDCPQKIKDLNASNPAAKKQYKFIHVVMPRTAGYQHGSKKKDEKKVASYYVCVTTREMVKEGGFDEMPYSVGRFYKTNYEKYGRSPALEVYSTLPMINRMEVSRLRGAERVSNPPWLSPNDGSVRRISNDSGGIIYWNAGNPASKPEQLRVADNVMVNDEMISKKEQEVMDAFYVPLFNPLLDKRNMTATESSQRIDMSMQFLLPAANRLNKYFVRVALERAFGILLRAGRLPSLDIPELSGVALEFELVGKASLAARQIELYGTMTALEQTALIGQIKPEVWDNWDLDKTARLIQEVNMAPVSLQMSEDGIKQLREVRAQQQQAAQAQQALTATSDAYAKTLKKPEAGSGAEALAAAAEDQM